MIGQNHKSEKEKGSINPLAAAATGIIIGAGAVAIGTVAMQDTNTREKVKEVLKKVRTQAVDYLDTIQEQQKSTITKNLPNVAKTIKKQKGQLKAS